MARRLLAVVWVGLVAVSPAQAFTKEDVRVTMSDGAVLACSVYRPDGTPPAGGRPAIMMLHGLGQSRSVTNVIAESFFAERGYVVLTVDTRGHGESEGLDDIAGPREVQDVRELFAWLADRPDVDGRRIGGFGISLGGGALWRAAGEGTPFAALVPVAAWTDLYRALYPGNLAKSGAVLSFLADLPPERFSPLVNELRTDLLLSRNLEAIRTLAAERSSRELLGRVRAPVFVLQGRRDFAFDLTEARTAFGRVGGPRRLYIGDLGHAPASNRPRERGHYLTEVRQWFDRWLRGLPNGIDRRPRVEVAPDPWTGRTFQYRSLPAARAVRLALPGRKTMTPEGKVVRAAALPRRKLETFGAPVVRVTASTPTGWPRLVAVLSAITPGGREIVVSAGGAQTRSLAGRAREVTLRLADQATPIPRGSRLRVTLATSSTAQNPDNRLYLQTLVPPGVKLSVGRVRITLPVLRRPIS